MLMPNGGAPEGDENRSPQHSIEHREADAGCKRRHAYATDERSERRKRVLRREPQGHDDGALDARVKVGTRQDWEGREQVGIRYAERDTGADGYGHEPTQRVGADLIGHQQIRRF